VHVMLVVDYAAQQEVSLPIRFAALMHDLGKGSSPPEHWPSHHGHEQRGVALVEAVCQRLKVPSDCRDLAVMTARDHGNVGRALEMRPATLLELFERCDAFRKPQRFLDMLKAAECDCFGRSGLTDIRFPQPAFLAQALAAAQAVNAGEIAQGYLGQPQKIAEAIRRARIAAIKNYREQSTFLE
jgi:tRNA nucleotidyltransferase (CCA-adding enzyme)